MEPASAPAHYPSGQRVLEAIAPFLKLLAVMKKSKQFSFFTDEAKSLKFFGGALLKGRRKSIRPLTSKDSIHLVLRSPWAMGSESFLNRRHYRRINKIINRFAKKFGVRIYQRAINSNHLHLLLRITNRRLYRSFIKAVSGQIASHVMGQQSFLDFSKTRAIPVTGDGSVSSNASSGFWEFRPFSRVVNWGRDFKMCVKYLKQNVLEAFGFIPYKPRRNFYIVATKLARGKICRNTS